MFENLLKKISPKILFPPKNSIFKKKNFAPKKVPPPIGPRYGTPLNYTQFLKCFLIDRSEIFLQLKAAAKKQKEQRFRGGRQRKFCLWGPFSALHLRVGLSLRLSLIIWYASCQ